MTGSDRPLVGDDLHEVRLRELTDEARERVDTKRRELDEAIGNFHVTASRLAARVRERVPNDDELVFGDATCACGAAVAHWPDALHEAWQCSAVLLGRANDGPDHDEPRLFVVSRIRTARGRVTRSA